MPTSADVDVLMILAESEARYRDPLFAMLRFVELEAALEVSGEAAEGREVVTVSERLVSVPA